MVMWKFFFKVLKKSGLKNAFNFFIRRRINDVELVIPVLGEIGKGNLYSREKWMYELISKITACKEGCFVDVGINIGQTLIHYKTATKDGHYIGFEPNPVCIYYTQQLVQKNKWEHCTIIPCGIHQSNSLMAIHYYSIGTDSMASFVPGFRSDRKVIKTEFVPCFNIHAIQSVLRDSKISCIKIDVEGSEPEVIKELSETIHEERPFVIAELLPPKDGQDVEGKTRIEQVFNFFMNSGYKTFRVNKNAGSQLNGLEEITNPFFGLSRQTADHFFCPQELAHQFRLENKTLTLIKD